MELLKRDHSIVILIELRTSILTLQAILPRFKRENDFWKCCVYILAFVFHKFRRMSQAEQFKLGKEIKFGNCDTNCSKTCGQGSKQDPI